VVKDLCYETGIAKSEDVAAKVSCGDAGCLLPTMLKSVEGEVGVLGNLKTGCDYPKDTAFITGTFAGVNVGRGHGVR
jgi:hypothetical protein